MTDPYSILGIDRNATEDEIKKAYRRLSRKYHPDANINNPHKDEAEAKFKEVQQAYKQIMDERERGYSSDGSAGESAYGNGGYGPFGGFGGYGPFGGGPAGGPGGREKAKRMRICARRRITYGAAIMQRRLTSWMESRTEERSGISTALLPTPARETM